MSQALVKNKCAHCGKDISQEKRVVVMADMKWVFGKYDGKQDSNRVKFTPGIETRSAYCNVHCLKKDLDKYLDNSIFTADYSKHNSADLRLN